MIYFLGRNSDRHLRHRIQKYRIQFPWDGLKAADVDAVLVGEGDLHHTRERKGGKVRR